MLLDRNYTSNYWEKGNLSPLYWPLSLESPHETGQSSLKIVDLIRKQIFSKDTCDYTAMDQPICNYHVCDAS